MCKVKVDVVESQGMYEIVDKYLSDEQKSCFHGPCLPDGCANCHGQGYDGRDGLFEVMMVDSKMRQMIGDSAKPDTLRTTAIENEMIDFQRGARIKIGQGLTSPDEILRIISPELLGL